jgi:hypothetical protein
VRVQLAPPVIDIEQDRSKETALALRSPLQDLSKDVAEVTAAHSALAARLQRIEHTQDALLRAATLWGALWGAVAALVFGAFVLWVAGLR